MIASDRLAVTKALQLHPLPARHDRQFFKVEHHQLAIVADAGDVIIGASGIGRITAQRCAVFQVHHLPALAGLCQQFISMSDKALAMA